MRIFISLCNATPDTQKVVDSQNVGPITFTVVTERTSTETAYSITWLNKMTNIETRFIKLGKDSYVIESKAPKTPLITYTYTELRDAAMTFFVNIDTSRLSETLEQKLKRTAADKIKMYENKRTLNINMKPTIRREHKALYCPVLVGAKQDIRGIMVGINWAGSRAKVAILDKNGHTVKVIELETELLWIP